MKNNLTTTQKFLSELLKECGFSEDIQEQYLLGPLWTETIGNILSFTNNRKTKYEDVQSKYLYIVSYFKYVVLECRIKTKIAAPSPPYEEVVTKEITIPISRENVKGIDDTYLLKIESMIEEFLHGE